MKTLKVFGIAALMAIALALVLAPPVSAQQYGGSPLHWYWASDYNTSVLVGPGPNTYTWNLSSTGPGSCQSIPNGGAPPYFVFGPAAHPFPQWIQDDNPALSEVVTPSTSSITGATCGFSASTVNNHTTFWVKSGTCGLYEALYNNVKQPYPATIYIDPTWKSCINSLPGTNSLATEVAALPTAFGSGTTQIVDTTTEPWSVYSWNGVLYEVEGAQAQFNQSVSSFTNVVVPTALTTVTATCATNLGGCITTATTGGTIPASGAYTLGATCVDASGGETTLSVDTAGGATVTVGSTATNTISVTSPGGCTAAAGGVGWRLYMTAASGGSLSEILYTPTCSVSYQYPPQSVLASVCPIGSTATISAVITGTATVPLVNSAWPRLSDSSNNLPPFTAGGTIATTVTGTMATVNLPAGFLNSLGREVSYCGEGNVTTNGTTGTLTLKVLLASLVGTTSITPFTVTSGTTTASADVPINFCVKFTTAKTGATGTLWASGCADFVLNPASVTTGTVACSTPVAVSSAVDLTKQDQLQFDFVPTTTGSTAFQMTQLTQTLSN